MEKPILFNTKMVQAILEGRKTQTRRLVKPIKSHYVMDGKPTNNPPCNPGDILWVRETWNYGYVESSDAEGSHESWFEELRKPATGYLGALSRYFYLADKADEQIMDEIGGKWRPSIHMPKDAARIFLKVKSVRSGRLQEYFDASCAHAEGIIIDRPHSCQEAVEAFVKLWNSTIKPAELPRFGWDANPWVWVIIFERIDGGPAGLFADRNTAQYADGGALAPAT